jgi:hypothetical protein
MPCLGFAVLSAACLIGLTSANANLRRDLQPPIVFQTGWEYVGCFVDGVAERSLDGAVYFDAAGLTAETCISYCEEAGFAYAGMEYSAECCK